MEDFEGRGKTNTNNRGKNIRIESNVLCCHSKNVTVNNEMNMEKFVIVNCDCDNYNPKAPKQKNKLWKKNKFEF